MIFGSWKNEGFFYRLLSGKEQKKLSRFIQDWLERVKQERGVHIFSRQGEYYMVIAAGMKPNPGYRLEIVGMKKEEDGTAGIWVREKTPNPGKMLPQVITYPYLIIQVKGDLPLVYDAETGVNFVKGNTTTMQEWKN
ncbi:protease complex subunit PrcB family protein [Melghirimyces algeriensis]|uniref:PrcB C-terminal n=1 Tax=Melghirimyces algeriensis TaxID=910412 RepID=A0A521AXF0_9BACL|nr:protease complex subunit PrcB family protein [Melghirimyces algeriensis]SMO39496.1 PrcB C-terminal [Melghirimyces algeriensis]